jgi:hypothetical protein
LVAHKLWREGKRVAVYDQWQRCVSFRLLSCLMLFACVEPIARYISPFSLLCHSINVGRWLSLSVARWAGKSTHKNVKIMEMHKHLI